MSDPVLTELLRGEVRWQGPRLAAAFASLSADGAQVCLAKLVDGEEGCVVAGYLEFV